MKRLENLLLNASGFAVMIVLLFFLFTAVTDFTEAAIKFGTFALILLFGFIIACANLVLGIERLKFIYRLLIHYAALLISFIVVFILAGNIASGGPSAIFSAVVIFTFLYTVFFLLFYFIKRAISAADKRLDKKHPKKKQEKKSYQSLYK